MIVIVTSALSGLLLKSVVVSGSISDILANISDNLTLMRLSILVELVTSIGIVVLAVLLYVVLHKQNKIIAVLAAWDICSENGLFENNHPSYLVRANHHS